MYSIEEASYGFRIVSSGEVSRAEAEKLRLELMRLMTTQGGPFSMLADLRGMISAKPEVLEIVGKMQADSKLMSLKRAAIIVSSPVVRAQIKQSTFKAGTENTDRFIDASQTDDWETQALAWVEDAVEPVGTLQPLPGK
ncbi:MAG: hypothetical protein GY854_04275 [Deltaproteobacteria bacterium]|nr:hypothetical protein [Deltaproteobacteria bacterium]